MRFLDSIQTQQKQRFISVTVFILIVAALAGAFFLLVSGDVGEAASGDVILLWDGASIPAGWECISCSATGSMFGVFPRGSSTFANASSGSNTHGHSAAFDSHTQGASTTTSVTGTDYPAGDHVHTVANLAIGDSDHRPPFQNLQFIRANNPTTLPNGTIAMFQGTSSTLPANWNYYSAMEGQYLRGDANAITGGSPDHAHTITASATAPTDTIGIQPGGTQALTAGTAHEHVVSGSSVSASNTPPYVNVVFAKLTTTSTIPLGLIAMFDASPVGDWQSLSGAGGDFNGRFPRGAQTYGATTTTSTHSHATSTVTSQQPTTTGSSRSGTLSTATDVHTHDFTFTNFSTETNLPEYRDIIFAQYDRPTYEQVGYRWYESVDNVQPGPALAAENASATDVAQGEALRLRIGVQIGNAQLATTTQRFTLEFADKGGFASCDVVPGGNFARVGGIASSTIWRGHNAGASASDGDTIASVLLSSSTAVQSYEEENDSVLNPTAVPVDGVGEWDWALENNGATSDAVYCFRMVLDNGTELGSYSFIPELRVVKPLTQIRYRWRSDDGGE